MEKTVESSKRIKLKITVWTVSIAVIFAIVFFKNNVVSAIQQSWTIGTCEIEVDHETGRIIVCPKSLQSIIRVEDLKIDNAHYVADPFLIFENDTFFIFFEIKLTGKGVIGLSTSKDFIKWEYQGVVFEEPFHISYPHVFKHDNTYFMVPETGEANSIRLYRAKSFPNEWELSKILLDDCTFTDPTILYYHNEWWLFATDGVSDLHLFHSTELDGPYIRHPQNPIIKNEPNRSRSAGSVIVFGEKLLRTAQDCSETYGKSVRLFEITSINKYHYDEKELIDSPILNASGSGWNSHGMHQLSIHQVDPNRWQCVVDGKRIPENPYIAVNSVRIGMPHWIINTLRWVKHKILS